MATIYRRVNSRKGDVRAPFAHAVLLIYLNFNAKRLLIIGTETWIALTVDYLKYWNLEDGPGIPSLPLECLKKALDQMQLRKVDDTEPWRPFTVELMT